MTIEIAKPAQDLGDEPGTECANCKGSQDLCVMMGYVDLYLCNCCAMSLYETLATYLGEK